MSLTAMLTKRIVSAVYNLVRRYLGTGLRLLIHSRTDVEI